MKTLEDSKPYKLESIRWLFLHFVLKSYTNDVSSCRFRPDQIVAFTILECTKIAIYSTISNEKNLRS